MMYLLKFFHFSVFLNFISIYIWSEFSKNSDKSIYLEALHYTVHGACIIPVNQVYIYTIGIRFIKQLNSWLCRYNNIKAV